MQELIEQGQSQMESQLSAMTSLTHSAWEFMTSGSPWATVIMCSLLGLYVLVAQNLDGKLRNQSSYPFVTAKLLGILWPLYYTLEGIGSIFAQIRSIGHRDTHQIQVQSRIRQWEAGNSEPIIQEPDRKDAIAINIGTKLEIPAKQSDLEAIDRRVKVLEGAYPEKGAIDNCESSVMKGYRAWKGDYVLIGNRYAHKDKETGRWTEHKDDGTWPERMFEVLPGNFTYKLYKEAREAGLLKDCNVEPNNAKTM